MNLKKIHLTIAKTYVSDWGIWEAFRELAQNAMDHTDATNTPMLIGFNKKTSNLLITSANTKLDVNTLVLGTNDKASNPTQRGQFGEGYKLALVVLLRLGIDVKILNANEVWIPKFEYSETFNTEILTISISTIKTKNKDVTFVLKGITKSQANQLSNRVIRDRSKSIGYRTKFGRILTEERFKGQVFVGGIYVCKPQLKDLEHGYDFDPEHVELGRDRGLIDSFNVQWLATKMWSTIFTPDTKVIEETAKLISAGSPAMRHYGVSSSNSAITEKVSRDFYTEFSDTAVPVMTELERKRVLNEYDNAIPIIVSEVVKRTVNDSDIAAQNKRLLRAKLHLTPNEVITQVLGKYKHELGGNFQKLSQELIPVSLHWLVDLTTLEEDSNA